MLKACYDEYEHVVGFSATLKPFNYYSKLSGLESENLKTAEFQSPFARENRKLLIIPQISTKFSERARNYPRISETIHRISTLKRGNYFAFFPSFDFMERVFQIFAPPEGFTVLKQERDMKASDVEGFLEHLRSEIAPTIVFAVSGGIFSEGVDYPGKMIIGAFVVGPPLPSFDLEREQMREYYQNSYNAGFDYAYTYPAMSKAVQAAGRVIRSETDRGLIVLMDSRFVHSSYAQSMPKDWFEQSPRELVSQSILKEVSEFWSEPPASEDQSPIL
jgi:DNA excision repair protein ERCC-2